MIQFGVLKTFTSSKETFNPVELSKLQQLRSSHSLTAVHLTDQTPHQQDWFQQISRSKIFQFKSIALEDGMMVHILKNIARVQNCPDVTISNSLLGLCFLSFCLFIFLSFFRIFFVSFRLFVLLYFCYFVFCIFIFVSFCLFVKTSCWSNVWRVSSVKSHSLCQNTKVATVRAGDTLN